MMERKVLSLYEAGNRLTKQSFRDEDEKDPDLLENKNEESKSDSYLAMALMSVLGKHVNIF
jgi:hypothetical protein